MQRAPRCARPQANGCSKTASGRGNTPETAKISSTPETGRGGKGRGAGGIDSQIVATVGWPAACRSSGEKFPPSKKAVGRDRCMGPHVQTVTRDSDPQNSVQNTRRSSDRVYDHFSGSCCSCRAFRSHGPKSWSQIKRQATNANVPRTMPRSRHCVIRQAGGQWEKRSHQGAPPCVYTQRLSS
jgi:hypothetical protein